MKTVLNEEGLLVIEYGCVDRTLDKLAVEGYCVCVWEEEVLWKEILCQEAFPWSQGCHRARVLVWLEAVCADQLPDHMLVKKALNRLQDRVSVYYLDYSDELMGY